MTNQPKTVEFVIHLMQADNNGNSLAHSNNLYLERIARAFGGFTVAEGSGAWYSEESKKLYVEPVLRVVIACEETAENSSKLKAIALDYKQEAAQEAVYIRTIGGTVLFV